MFLTSTLWLISHRRYYRSYMIPQFSIALITLVILDGLWPGLIMKDFWGAASCAAAA